MAAIWAATPALAESPIKRLQGKGDPNEIVCERFTVIGSRLTKKTACATRQEWADRRRTDRVELEVQQKTVCIVGIKSSGRCGGN